MCAPRVAGAGADPGAARRGAGPPACRAGRSLRQLAGRARSARTPPTGPHSAHTPCHTPRAPHAGDDQCDATPLAAASPARIIHGIDSSRAVTAQQPRRCVLGRAAGASGAGAAGPGSALRGADGGTARPAGVVRTTRRDPATEGGCAAAVCTAMPPPHGYYVVAPGSGIHVGASGGGMLSLTPQPRPRRFGRACGHRFGAHSASPGPVALLGLRQRHGANTKHHNSSLTTQQQLPDSLPPCRRHWASAVLP